MANWVEMDRAADCRECEFPIPAGAMAIEGRDGYFCTVDCQSDHKQLVALPPAA